MIKIEAFGIGTKIKIGLVDATIIGFSYPDMEYKIAYWNNGDRKIDWISGHEITEGEIKKIGYTLEIL